MIKTKDHYIDPFLAGFLNDLQTSICDGYQRSWHQFKDWEEAARCLWLWIQVTLNIGKTLI